MKNKFRYPGTKPFLEEDSHLFFGRDLDKEKLTELVILEELVVLFGKSGYGKSSLLNAAVIPNLREQEKHEVFNIRLIEPAVKNTALRSPLELLTDQLKSEMYSSKLLEEKLNIPIDLTSDITANIWYYAKIIQLAKPEINAITLVFDQFEELSYFSEAEVEAFGRTLGALLNHKPPKSVRSLIKQKFDANAAFFTKEERHDILKPLNLKVVFSLHHDRLNLLDQLKQFLPSVFKYMYELKPLSENQAKIAFTEPAALKGDFASPEFTYTREAINFIFDNLKDSKNQLIEPFQLQLIGQHAEQKIIAKKKNAELKAKLLKKVKPPPLPKQFELLKKDLDKPATIYKKHYNKVIASLPFLKKRNVRNLIEKVLIIGENRVPMPEIVISSQYKVSKKTLDDLLDKRLLRSELNTVQETSYELSHDSLVKPILESAKRRKRIRLWQLVIGVLLIIIGLLCYKIYDLMNDTESNNIIINPIATATVIPTEGEAPLEVRFTFAKKVLEDHPTVVNYYWDFGEGGKPSKSDTLLYNTYETPGEYKVKLHVIGSDSIARIEEIDIIVSEPDTMTIAKPGKVAIKASPEIGNVPLDVEFNAIIPEDITDDRYLWEFNDGHTSKEIKPLHKFETDDTFNVRLTVWDIIKDKTHHDSIIIKVGKDPPGPDQDPANQAPVADLRASRFTGKAPLKVKFDGSFSTDDAGISKYLWEFNDGETSSDPVLSHTFDSIRDYDVRLTVWDAAGLKDAENKTIKIADYLPLPIAGISTSDTIGIAPFEVTFQGRNTSDSGFENNFSWNFPGGITSSLSNPKHVFAIAGSYDVQLTVTDIEGRVDSSFVKITVKPFERIPRPQIPPIAIAAADKEKGKVPFEVQFTGSNSTPADSISKYFWDFDDDNTTSDLPDPKHTFSKLGSHKVYLKVSTGAGLMDSDTLLITVHKDQPPVAVIAPSSNGGAIPFEIVLNGNNSTDDGAIVSYNWYLGDSLITNHAETKSSISHKFVDIGTHDVKLRVTDDIGQSGETEIQISAFDPIPRKPDSVEASTWLQRFIGVQKLHLPEEFDNTNAWKNWSIIPDSLNIMGILIPDSLLDHEISENRYPALLFFFTNKGTGESGRKVYKFRNEITNSEIKNVLRSERFNLKGLIRQARKDAENRDNSIIRKYIAPNQFTVRVDTSEIKDMARLLEKNKLNDKTLNVYYTLFPLSHFDQAVKDTVLDIYTRLTPLQGQQ